MRILYALLTRWSLLGVVLQFVGVLLIAYGFWPRASETMVTGTLKPEPGFIPDPATERPYTTVNEHTCAFWSGWVLLVVGYLLQIVAEVLAALRAA